MSKTGWGAAAGQAISPVVSEEAPRSSRPPERPKPTIRPPRGLSAIGAVGWSLATVFVAFLVLDLTRILRPGASGDLVNGQLCFSLAFALMTVLVVHFHLSAHALRDVLGARPTHPALYVIGLLGGVALQLPSDTLGGLMDQLYPRSEEELASYALLFQTHSVAHKIMLAASAAAIGPLSEEIFCRGVLYRALRVRSSTSVVVVVTAVCFALLHLSLRDMPAIFMCGLVLGAFRAMSGSMLVPLMAHMAYNGVVIFTVLAGITRMDESGSHLPWYFGVAGALAVGGLLFATATLSKSSALVQAAVAEDEA